MAPGINRLGRETGTVPKTKTPNNTGRDHDLGVSRTTRSNIPNNLTSQDWQSPGPSTNRTRKNSNTRTSLRDYYEGADSRIVQEHSRYPPGNQESVSVNKVRAEVNGIEVSSSSSAVRRDCVRRTSRNVMPDTENKSNITKMPDRNQISTRLNQIRDYIEQTSTIMESLKSSGQPSHLAQYHKLAGMVVDLKDSETKLASLLSRYEEVPSEPQDEKASEEEGNAVVEADQGSIINIGSSGMLNGHHDSNGVCENGSGPSDANKRENGAVLKTADSSRCNELRMKLEESQKKLLAMQEHQSALQALQQQTQQQLKEARAAQSSLMARTAAAAAVAATVSVSDEEQNPESVHNNCEAIRDHMCTLHVYDQRNPDKLQELQSKKERMDHLVAELQIESNGPSSGAGASLHTGREKSCESSKTGSDGGDEDGNVSDIECDVQRVRHKMAQLSAMKAQLRRLQNMVDTGLHDTELATGQACPIHADEADETEVCEEEAVNLRKQSQTKGRSVSRTNSTSSSTTKPDNISQASIGILQETELKIERKTQKLREAKAKLQQLQKLLSTVMDLRSRGEPVPEHYLQILEEETSRVDQEQAAEAAQAAQAAQEARALHQANLEREKEGAVALLPGTSAGVMSSQDSAEVTLEMVQAMALELRTQTQVLQEEKERLIRARQEIGNIGRDVPYKEKKTNTQMLLQAKRRELEELMRKDQGQSSAVNQDICSEVSGGKSELAGFSYIGEGTSTSTWRGSTQGTLEDLAGREDDVQEQSAGYSSDEAGNKDVSIERYLASQVKHPRCNTTSSCTNNNNTNNNNAAINKKETLAQSTSTNRDALSMSLESGVYGGSQCGNVNTVPGSLSATFPPPQPVVSSAQQRTGGPCNVWRKSSTDSCATLPRAVWTPSSQHPRTVDEMPANANATGVNTSVNHHENESNASNITQVNQSHSSSSIQNNWWQQQAMQLQSQLDATNNLYQSLLVEHQQQQQNMACWPQPPALAPVPGLRGPLPGGPNDAFYQQLLAATQFQQQQLLLTTINQCCHLLWMQQREMASLRGILLSLQDKLVNGNEGYPSAINFNQQPEDNFLISSAPASAHPTPHQSRNNLPHQMTNSSTPLSNIAMPHPTLKMSYSGGLVQMAEEHSSSSGAFSFHSLPNLPPPHVRGPFSSDPAAVVHPSSGSHKRNRGPQLQPLTQCSIPQAASQGTGGAPWLQQGSAGAPPGLLSAHTSSASPVPALNNQVPPGNRANNYWDNFRSYSRQNLLSSSTKSNEGVSHSPSPLVDRSRNTLRNSGLGQSHLSSYPMPEQGLPLNLSRKEKLNIERYHVVPDNYAVPSGGVPDLTELQYQQTLLNNQYQNTNMQVDQQIGPRVWPSSVSNNMSTNDGRGVTTWQNRSRSYRTQRGMNCKRKNPRLPPAATEHLPSSSSLASTPQERSVHKHREALCHRSGRSLFDVLSESIYTEVAALIAVNESRPHFLIQLFRDLQMVSSDPLRQRTLQSIHELVSRYLAEASGEQDGSITQNVKLSKAKELVFNDSLASSEEDEDENRKARTRVTAAVHSPPRNAVWNAREDVSLPNMLQHGHNEWELEAVLEDLLPFLKGHLDEICSPALLDAVRQQAVQLMLAQTQAQCRHNLPGSSHQPAGGYFQGQLDALLEDGLNKFQGCRLRDVCEDLLMVITDILQSELTFLKLIDTVHREVDESSEDVCKNPPACEEPGSTVHPLSLSMESAAQSFPAMEMNVQNQLESLGSTEGYNGDLAEADQSHHEEAAGVTSPQMEGDVAGAIIPEDSDDDGLLEIMQSDILRSEENQDSLAIALGREDCDEIVKTEAEDEWAVEQDREQGLDRVPTRLTDDPEGSDRPPGFQTNNSDASSNP